MTHDRSRTVMEPIAKTRMQALALSVLIALLGAWLAWMPFGIDVEEQFGLPVLFAWRGPRPPPPEVMIVGIDGRQALWPNRVDQWPRSRHAELIRRLHAGCARVIAYDVFFAGPRDATQDDDLARALREAGNVVLVSHLGLPNGPTSPALPTLALQVHRPPLNLFAEAAAGYAPFSLPGTQAVTGTWLFKADAGDLPNLPVMAYHIYRQPSSAQGPAGRLEALRMLRAVGEIDRSDRLATAPAYHFLNFYGPPRTIPTLNFADILAWPPESIPCTAGPFSDKAVFVGMSETSPVEQKDHDVFDTVYTDADGRRLSGVEIAATTFANLLEDRPLRRLDLSVSLAIICAWGLSVTLLWSLAGPLTASIVSLAATGLYGGLGLFLFADRGLWLPGVIPAMQLLMAGSAGTALQRAVLSRRLLRLRRSLTDWLPETVVAEIVADPAIRRHASGLVYGSCLAIRLEKTITASTHDDPLTLGRETGEGLRKLQQTVLRRNGSIGETTRRSLLGYWVAARPYLPLRQSACEALLDASGLLEELSPTSTRPTRQGLHAGLFAIDDAQAGTPRGFGEVVDTAEHIASLNTLLGTTALASQPALTGVDGLKLRPMGSFLFPGLVHPLAIAEVLGRSDDAGDPRIDWLCAAFDDALSAYRHGRFQECMTDLLEVLEQFPDDEPSRYYLRRCEFFRHHPPAGAWDPVVRL